MEGGARDAGDHGTCGRGPVYAGWRRIRRQAKGSGERRSATRIDAWAVELAVIVSSSLAPRGTTLKSRPPRFVDGPDHDNCQSELGERLCDAG